VNDAPTRRICAALFYLDEMLRAEPRRDIRDRTGNNVETVCNIPPRRMLLGVAMQVTQFTDGVPNSSRAIVPSSPWPGWQRVAFRFCFVYFSLYCLSNQILSTPFAWYTWNIPDLATLPPFRQIIFWVASHIFHFQLPLVYSDSGSGDKAFEWTLLPIMIVLALVATLIWSFLDRRRENYEVLLKWFRVAIRLLLAGQLLSYGFAKVFPIQMNFPALFTLVEPYGNFSPMGVLWGSIGASPAYEMFAGSAEVAAGLLLLVPRTALLGALLAAADMTQVWMLNMTYDVPVKLLSFHLLLLSLFLIAPDAKRLAQFLLTDHAVDPSPRPASRFFQNPRANRTALVLQLAFGVWLLGLNIATGIFSWKVYGGGQPKSPLHGIWNVDAMTVDGQTRTLDAATADTGRWRRLIFQYDANAVVQRWPVDDLLFYSLALDAGKRTIDLTRERDPKQSAHFTFDRTAPDTLTLDGEIDGHPAHLALKRMDETKMLLVSRGFHWRQDYPFNR
jgi:hypothetical protein